MTILCGTDFTAPSARAVDVAAGLAKRWSEPLRIVHVLDLPGAREVLRERDPRVRSRTREFVEAQVAEIEGKLHAEYDRVGAGLPSDPAVGPVLAGNPDEELVAEAGRTGARLIVLGAIGRRAGGPWRLGSTADRVAQTSREPVLVVRNPEGFAAWGRKPGERPLRILIGVERTAQSDAAVGWLEHLRAAGPCTVIGAHVYWPPEARERLKLGGPLPIGGPHVAVDDALEAELRTHLRTLPGGEGIELRIVGGLGRIADHLCEIAAEERAELIVVGSHQRAGFERMWHGSVSRGVIDEAPVSVLSVPSR